jgi:hypothetical protein
VAPVVRRQDVEARTTNVVQREDPTGEAHRPESSAAGQKFSGSWAADRDGNPTRVPKPSRDGLRLAKPACAQRDPSRAAALLLGHIGSTMFPRRVLRPGRLGGRSAAQFLTGNTSAPGLRHRGRRAFVVRDRQPGRAGGEQSALRRRGLSDPGGAALQGRCGAVPHVAARRLRRFRRTHAAGGIPGQHRQRLWIDDGTKAGYAASSDEIRYAANSGTMPLH